MFLGGGERMYWEQMGLNSSPKSYVTVKKLFISEKTQQRFSVGWWYLIKSDIQATDI